MDKQNKSATADRELATTRILDASRERVWQMWTDPEYVCKWWGPNGFTNTIHEMDVRPGGIWHLTMHGPEGTDYPNKITYIDVIKPELLRYHHGDEGQPGYFFVTVTFKKHGDNKTEIYMQGLFNTPDERNTAIEKFGAAEGMKQTVERLAELLAKV